MGYTHYWTVKGSVPKAAWATITADVRAIVELGMKSNIALAVEYDANEPPEIDADQIRFNGVGDDGHETFLINRVVDNRKPRYAGDNPKWTFCKTAQKPYDVVVTAILAYLDSVHPTLYSVTSDGDPADWVEGIALARAALPAQPISVPRAVSKVEA